MSSCQHAVTAFDQGLKTLTADDQNDAFLCITYLSGIIATAQHANQLAKLRYALATDGRGDQSTFNLYCFDWQLPYEKFARIVLAFSNKNKQTNPALLEGPAYKLALQALQTTFPCH